MEIVMVTYDCWNKNLIPEWVKNTAEDFFCGADTVTCYTCMIIGEGEYVSFRLSFWNGNNIIVLRASDDDGERKIDFQIIGGAAMYDTKDYRKLMRYEENKALRGAVRAVKGA